MDCLITVNELLKFDLGMFMKCEGVTFFVPTLPIGEHFDYKKSHISTLGIKRSHNHPFVKDWRQMF